MTLVRQRVADPEPFIHFHGVLSPEECAAVIAIGKALGTSTATTADGDTTQRRRSRVVWLHRQESVEWLFTRMEGAAAQTIQDWFPCDVNGSHEAIQITHYDAAMLGHYDWHMDMGGGDSRTRKLSMVSLLSDPADFDGGGLHVQWSPAPVHADMKRGDVALFPSYALHKVNPVVRGERWSLVWWMHGPVWR